MSRLARRWISWLIALVLWCGAPALLIGRDKSSTGYSDEETLHNSGLETDGPSLLAFFDARSRAAVDPDRLRVLLGQLTSWFLPQRSLATAEFLGLGPLAVPVLRRAVTAALAVPNGKPDAELLRALADPLAVRKLPRGPAPGVYIPRRRPKLTSVSDASQKRGSPQRFCEASLNLELILGRLLINRRQANKVVEFDREGRLPLLLKTPGSGTASQLPNGHVLLASYNNSRVCEMDRSGKIVWEYNGTGNLIRAPRR